MTSTVGYPKGHLVGVFEPFVHNLSSEFLDRSCSQCFSNYFEKKKGALRKCKGCLRVAYCDAVCQKKNWKIHRFECSLMKKATSLNPLRPMIPTDSVLFLYKLYCYSKTDKGRLRKDKIAGVERSYENFMSHVEEVKKDEVRMSKFSDACTQLNIFINNNDKDGNTDCNDNNNNYNKNDNDNEDISIPLLLEAFGKMVINSYSILDADLNDIGSGIYLGPSLLDHSCAYNTVCVFNGISLKLRTVTEIKPNEKLNICYIDNMSITKDRLSQLQKSYYFVCQCVLCKDDLRDREMDVSTMDAGDGADFGGRNQERRRLQEDVKVLDLRETRSHDTKKLLESWEGRLGARNIGLFHLLLRHYEGCVMGQRWQEAAVAGDRITDYYEHYVTNPLPNYAHHMVKLAKMHLFLRQNLKALELLEKAQPLIQTLFDKQDDLTHSFHQVLTQTKRELSIQ